MHIELHGLSRRDRSWQTQNDYKKGAYPDSCSRAPRPHDNNLATGNSSIYKPMAPSTTTRAMTSSIHSSSASDTFESFNALTVTNRDSEPSRKFSEFFVSVNQLLEDSGIDTSLQGNTYHANLDIHETHDVVLAFDTEIKKLGNRLEDACQLVASVDIPKPIANCRAIKKILEDLGSHARENYATIQLSAGAAKETFLQILTAMKAVVDGIVKELVPFFKSTNPATKSDALITTNEWNAFFGACKATIELTHRGMWDLLAPTKVSKIVS